uniref:YjbQ family protein n=1 Tax=Ignisphaera aggregans TaxID=334771 RepID=A0A7C4FD01_9CREN
MTALNIKTARMWIKSPGYTAEDITNYVASVLKEMRFRRGIAVVHTPERGCNIVEIEYEPNLLKDLESLLKNSGCMDSSICSALLSKSIIIPVHNGSMLLGQFKKVVFIDLSRDEGLKEVIVVGEGVFEVS